MKKIWPFTFYFWQYAGVAFMAPFVVLYYQKIGFTGGQIGLLAGLYPLITLFSAPLWTGFADATRKHKLILGLTLLGGTLTVFVYPFLTAFLPILFLVVGSSFFLAPVSSLADSATMSMLGNEKEMYGRLRLGGTFGFAIAAPIAGQLVQGFGLKIAFWGCALMYFLALLTSLKLVHDTEQVHPLGNASLGKGSRELMSNPRWLLFLAGALGGGFAMAVTNNYFFPYMKELGANESTMGLALTLGTVCEVPVMFFGNRLLGYFKAYPLFIFSLVITGIRLVLLALAGNPIQALIIQPLNGLAFPAMWMAGVSYVDEYAPAGMSATAQGIFGAAVFGLGNALGGFIGGSLLESLGARGMCMVFGIVMLLIVAAVLLIGRLLPARAPQPVL